jgi:hypothetical protein
MMDSLALAGVQTDPRLWCSITGTMHLRPAQRDDISLGIGNYC